MTLGIRSGKKRTTLQPSAALVMIMAAPLYKDGITGRFMDELDLSSGIRLKEKCDSVCPWYGEVVLDRKYLIHHLASAHIASSHHPCRVVIPAAGMSPLALQLVDEWSDEKLTEVIEFDLSGMQNKKKIYRRLVPDESDRLKPLAADISSEHDISQLIPETDLQTITIIVLEGITYYLPPDTISRLLRHFSSPTRSNRAIIEYTQPCGDFSPERQALPKGIFRCIMDACGLDRIYPYHISDIEQFVRIAGGDVVHHYSLTEMEKMRTGTNKYFPRTEDGWKWCADAEL